MRLFANLVYLSFFARLWLLAFGRPVAPSATWVILILTVLCVAGEFVLWVQGISQKASIIDKVVKAKVDSIKNGTDG